MEDLPHDDGSDSSGGQGWRGRPPSRDRHGHLVAGRYRIEHSLGVGAMGEVYRAEHELMRKTVALKILHPEYMAHDEIVERFHREAQAAANINHPNVCAATDFGETEDGSFFLVMEYLEGATLDDTLEDEARLTPERAVAATIQICEALSAAHELGVVHRDLKPENIMLVRLEDGSEQVKILDFGVAHVRLGEGSRDAQLTQAGMVYGTPEYMAPEQAAGDEVDARSDLYAVGIILFHMLTGSPPFRANTVVRLLGMHLTQPPPMLHELVPDAHFPRRLQRIVSKLLEKTPDKRYASAAELRLALLEAKDHLAPRHPTLATLEIGTAVVERATRQAGKRFQLLDRRRQAAIGVGVAALILMLAVGLGYALSGDDDSNEQAIAEQVDGEATTAIVEQDKSLEDERRELARDPAIRDALDLIAVADVDQAIHKLELLRIKFADNPHFHYYTGIAHAQKQNWTLALSAYAESLRLEPRYANDTKVNDDLLTCLKSADAEGRKALTQLFTEPVHPKIDERFRTLARTHKSRKIRRRAQKVLQQTKRFEALPQWEQLSIHLMNSSGCKVRRKLIIELGELGDARGIDALQHYNKRPTSGCGFLNRKDCIACLRPALRDNIARLEQQPAPESRTDADGT